MAEKRLKLNPGAQQDFVNNKSRYSAFVGGVGSGKTFAGIARGLQYTQQPKAPGRLYGPRGLCAAINYPVLMDVVVPQFLEMVEGTDLLLPGDKGWAKSQKKATFRNGAEVLFRSLDRPNWMRGLELSWFFIDEGRHLTKEAWDILVGRLRQPGYNHAGWVCSTPNGYDWMWNIFHPDSPGHWDGAVWYNSPTYQNQLHLPKDYIHALEASYEGKFFRQEVLGEFIGLMSGAVFPHWSSPDFAQTIAYDPSLPLYSFWDFGVGDLGVCLFAQIAHHEKELPDGAKVYVPELRILSLIEHSDWGAKEWAHAWREHLNRHYGGRTPDMNVGDPAGRQRSAATGTSVIDALAAQGVTIVPAPKKAPDHAVLILDNMMAGGRVLVDKETASRMAAAFATHRWQVDDAGNRTSGKPVHDWTSHFCDAARYGATQLLGHFARREPGPVFAPPPPGTVGHIVNQILQPHDEWLGQPTDPVIDWVGRLG